MNAIRNAVRNSVCNAVTNDVRRHVQNQNQTRVLSSWVCGSHQVQKEPHLGGTPALGLGAEA